MTSSKSHRASFAFPKAKEAAEGSSNSTVSFEEVANTVVREAVSGASFSALETELLISARDFVQRYHQCTSWFQITTHYNKKAKERARVQPNGEKVLLRTEKALAQRWKTLQKNNKLKK